MMMVIGNGEEDESRKKRENEEEEVEEWRENSKTKRQHKLMSIVDTGMGNISIHTNLIVWIDLDHQKSSDLMSKNIAKLSSSI